jgi:hypothetical protein
MQILALSRRQPGVTGEQIAAHGAREAQASWALHKAGVIRSVHMCPERPGSMLVLDCESLDAARLHLQTLPMVQAGLIEFDLSRMLPYTAWESLFAPDTGSGAT